MNESEKNLIELASQYLINSTKEIRKAFLPYGFESNKELLEAIESEARACGHLLSGDEVTSIQFDRLILTLEVLINA